MSWLNVVSPKLPAPAMLSVPLLVTFRPVTNASETNVPSLTKRAVAGRGFHCGTTTPAAASADWATVVLLYRLPVMLPALVVLR